MSARESFVGRFGEAQAVAVEDAAKSHQDSVHAADDLGTDPFKYWFLKAIGSDCVVRYAAYHGITPSEADLRAWALEEGDLGSHDGSIPDYLAVLAGVYEGWVVGIPEGADR